MFCVGDISHHAENKTAESSADGLGQLPDKAESRIDDSRPSVAGFPLRVLHGVRLHGPGNDGGYDVSGANEKKADGDEGQTVVGDKKEADVPGHGDKHSNDKGPLFPYMSTDEGRQKNADQ